MSNWEIVTIVMIVALFVIGVASSYVRRNNLQISAFQLEHPDLPSSLRPLARLIAAELRRITRIHASARDAAGEHSWAADASLASLSQPLDVDKGLDAFEHPLVKPASVLLSIFRWLFRPPRIVGAAYLEGPRVKVRCTHVRRGQKDRELDEVSRDASREDLASVLARDVADTIVLAFSRPDVIASREAFRLVTEALAEMPRITINSPAKQNFAGPQAKLDAALEKDDGPLVHFNLGLIHYFRYSREANQKAIQHFKRSSRIRGHRLSYLGRIGSARSLAQAYHRYGQQEEDDLEKARAEAAKAVELVEKARVGKDKDEFLRWDYALALYVDAFAQHITEQPDDIDRGAAGYRRIIEFLGDRTPSVVHNNLGYILMAKAGRYVAGEGTDDLYDQAAAHFEDSLKKEPTYKFALANLGNVERLRGNYDEAIHLYEEALEHDPAYVNGHNELAWVYLQQGDGEAALKKHAKALELAQAPQHKAEVKEHYAHVLYELGEKKKAVVLAREALALNESNLDLKIWLRETAVGPTAVDDWRAARAFPHTYPGDRPAHSYLLLDRTVLEMRVDDPEQLAQVRTRDGRLVDDRLRERGLPLLGERYAVLAYGGNRNPGTLALKLEHYGYRSPGRGIAIPVLRGTVRGGDVVAGGVSGQGYCYGDLLLDAEWTRDTEVEAWLCLLDDDQLRVVNESEGVHPDRIGDYVIGRIPGYRLAGSSNEIAPLGYAGNGRIFVSPRLATPIAFSTVEAQNRPIAAMEPIAMWDHILEACDLREKVAAAAELPNDPSLARALCKSLNTEWWVAFHTKKEPPRNYMETLEVLTAAFDQHGHTTSMATALREQGRVVEPEDLARQRPQLSLPGLLGSV